MGSDRETLQKQAEKILEQAQKKGVQGNFFFVTTFQRYQVQMRILEELEQAIDEYGVTITKEYVKGRQNLVSNPAIAQYNSTTSSANKTVNTLIAIVKSFDKESDEGNRLDEFFSALNG